MKWRKLKHWLPQLQGYTHAAMPFYFEGDVYFSPRFNGCAEIWRAPFNPKTLELGVAGTYLGHGKEGQFDDCGAMVSWIYRHESEIRCYYIGWNRGTTVPFRNSLGMAINGEKLNGPILDRSLTNPYGVGSCCNGLDWYLSILGWERRGLRLTPRYHIVNGYPHSPAITFKDETEYAIARPCVIQERLNFYRMWYCYRGEAYRIGYAESTNGLDWERKDDETGITVSAVSKDSFDDEEVCYPHVFDFEGSRFMLYNGNGYGQSGFGLAILETA